MWQNYCNVSSLNTIFAEIFAYLIIHFSNFGVVLILQEPHLNLLNFVIKKTSEIKTTTKISVYNNHIIQAMLTQSINTGISMSQN